MVEDILEGLMQVGILIPLMCLLRRENVQNGFKLTLLFCGFFLMNKFLLVLPLNVKTFALFEGDWNWSGKLYAIIGSVLFYGLFKNHFSQHDFLVLKQAKGSY